jgi:hypothetical protein
VLTVWSYCCNFPMRPLLGKRTCQCKCGRVIYIEFERN